LRRLAAEVEDDDAVDRLRVVARRSFRCPGVQRYLEISLDLRVIGREHTVAGVGGLAVDCLAASRSLDELSLRLRPAPDRSLPAAVAPDTLRQRCRELGRRIGLHPVEEFVAELDEQ